MPESGDEFEVTFGHVRGADSAPIVSIDGVDGRDDADGFRGAIVLVDRRHLTPPEEDEYFLGDLDGCVVHEAAGGAVIGKVVRVESLPANIVLYVRMDASGKNVLVPFADIAVPHVDVEARRIDVDLEYLGVDATGAEL
jgi:16S rRNA processing protein RimM